MTTISNLLASIEAMEASGNTECEEYHSLCEEYMGEAWNLLEEVLGVT